MSPSAFKCKECGLTTTLDDEGFCLWCKDPEEPEPETGPEIVTEPEIEPETEPETELESEPKRTVQAVVLPCRTELARRTIVLAYSRGMTLHAIKQQTGYAVSSIYQVVLESGIIRRGAGERAEPLPDGYYNVCMRDAKQMMEADRKEE